MPSFEPVRAIMRGLQILRLVSEQGPINTMDIARQLSLPQPTVVRILETLIEAGYVYRIENTAQFAVTARVLTLSRGFAASSRLVQLATPLIEDLRSEIGWPSNLATYENGAMVIGYTNRAEHGMSIPGRLGARIPLTVTGVGMVYLASLGPEQLEDVMRALRRSDSRWDNDPEILAGLSDRLRQVRETGYGLAAQPYLDALYSSQIWAVAVPVSVGDRVVAGLSSLVLRSAGTPSRIISRILPALQKTAAEIGARMAEDSGLNDMAEPPKHRGRKKKSAE